MDNYELKRIQSLKFLLCVSLITIAMFSSLCTADDTLRRGNGAEPDSLNPHVAQGLNSHNILNDLYEGLFTYGVSGQAIPGVADRYQISKDGLRWDFYLNPDAKWSDGEPVTAEDFIQGWNKAIAASSAAPYAFLFEPMQSEESLRVSSQHKHHLRIQLNHTDPSLPDKLLLPVFAPIPTHDPDYLVYNGAYMLTEHRPHEWIKIEKNPYFHSAKDINIKTIYYDVTENQNSELLKFRAGELDITETIPDSQLDWLRANYPKALRIAPYNGSFYLGLNLADSYLKDIHLRQALHWSIDRDILVDKVLKSGQKPASGLIPIPDQATNAFNLVKAKQYLAQSGFNPDSDRLELLYNNSHNQKKTALAVAAMWRQFLGIKTRLKKSGMEGVY
jgi:ABC-type oligopeptide transport system, periplasmic component